MRYVYYRKEDHHKVRILLVRKSLKAAFEEAKMGTGLIVEVDNAACKSVEHLIQTVEAKVKAKDYLPVEGLIDGIISKAGTNTRDDHWNKAPRGGTSRNRRPRFGSGRDNPRAKGNVSS